MDTGIVFIRTDLLNGARAIPARWNNVVDTKLCTVVGNDHGARVSTIEHLMSALYATGIDNAFIEIDGAEVPVMDGSADDFMFLLAMAGTSTQNAPRKVIEILGVVEVKRGEHYVRLSPAMSASFNCEISFDRAPIKHQNYSLDLSASSFKSEISRARTFGFFEEVEAMRSIGLARGGSLDNAVVIKGDKVLNSDGLRYADEFVRHKLLDAVGDIALAGGLVRGQYDGYGSGHALNNQLLRALFANPKAWQITTIA
jgi:UDP-3-O-[3-hydroxymyristoyl] N-acetylglucosamine deacetylase